MTPTAEYFLLRDEDAEGLLVDSQRNDPVRFVKPCPEECGHVTYAEQPDAFARAVATFASELGAPAEARGV